jgi:hypothetical protein
MARRHTRLSWSYSGRKFCHKNSWHSS